MFKRRCFAYFVSVLILMLSVVSPCAISQEELTSPSAILMEPTTHKILFEKNANEQRACASITKVMTLLLVMEAIEDGKIAYDDIVTTSEHAKSMGGSDIWLEVGEQMTVDEMIKATAVASANDAAVALAEHLCGTEDEFVAQMNVRAKELGMENTVFKNCNGLDEEGHLTTAYDVAIMSCELIKHEKIFDYTQPIGMTLYVLLIILFSYFYAFVQVNPEQVAENLKKQGGYVPGIRPGKATEDYLKNVLIRLTFVGSIFLAVIAILPTFFVKFAGLPDSVQIGGTSLLIVVGVALETMKGLEAQLVKRHYKGFIK